MHFLSLDLDIESYSFGKKKRLVQKWKKWSFFNRKKNDYFTNYW